MNIYEFIVCAATLLNSVLIIYNISGKPVKFFKKKREDELQERWKQYLKTYSQEVTKVVQADMTQHIEKVVQDSLDKALEPLKKEVVDIKKINLDQSQHIKDLDAKIETLDKGTKDILRQKIMTIYHANKHTGAWTVYDKECFDELYKDYRAEGGNSYICKYYNRTRNWDTFDPEKEEKE